MVANNVDEIRLFFSFLDYRGYQKSIFHFGNYSHCPNEWLVYCTTLYIGSGALYLPNGVQSSKGIWNKR